MDARSKYKQEYSWVRYWYRHNGYGTLGNEEMTEFALSSYRNRAVTLSGFVNPGRRVQFTSERSIKSFKLKGS